MTDLLTTFNVRRTLAQGPAIGDLPPAVTPTGVAFSLLLLAPQVLPKAAALGLVCVHMLVKRLIAQRQLAGDLFGAQLHPQQGCSLFLDPGFYRVRIAAVLGAFNRPFTGLLWSLPTRADIAAQLAADRGLVTSNQAGDLRDAVLGFHKAGNLVSFNLAGLFVIHRATSTCRTGSLEC